MTNLEVIDNTVVGKLALILVCVHTVNAAVFGDEKVGMTQGGC